MGVADRVMMLENAIYSVASPEAAASIIWRDSSFAEHAAQALGLTSDALYEAELIDKVIVEPAGGAHRDYDGAASNLKAAVVDGLDELASITTERLVEARYAKFRAMSAHVEQPQEAENSR